MKLKIITAVALLGLSLAPAFAGEGNGEPFRNNAGTLGTHAALAEPAFADTGSAAFPSWLLLGSGVVRPGRGSWAASTWCASEGGSS